MRANRAMVRALAGVTRAVGPKVVDTQRPGSWRSASRSGPAAPVTRTVANAPDRQRLRDVDHAVDLGGLPEGPADARLVDEHLDGAADEGVAPGRGDVVLQGPQLGQPLGDQRGRHGAVEAGGVGALLGRVGEEPAPVELGPLDEGQQLVVVGLRLARVADDEVGPEGGLGLAPPDVVDAGGEAAAVAPAPHAAQQGTGHVLEREVEVGHARGAHARR